VTMFANGLVAANQIVSLLIPASGKATLSDDGWHVYDANGVQQYVGTTGPTGPRGATYQGAYSGATAYVKDDVVTNNGSAWINILASTGAAPPTLPTVSNANWSLLSAKGDQGIQGVQGNPGVVTTVTADAPISGGGSASTVHVGLSANGVDNSYLAQMAAGTLKGNNTGSTANALDLTAAQTTAMLNAATTALQGMMAAADKVKLGGMWKDIVADFGADPTGAVDCTAIIQTAVDSFSASGGRLFFPAGSYKIDLATATTITISKPVIIRGAGRAITNLLCTHATKTVFTMAAGAQAAGFEQIRISGSTATTRTAGHMVDFGTQANCYIQQTDMIYVWSGVHSSGGLQFIDDMNIREVSQNAPNGQAVLIDSSGDRYIRRLTTDSGASISTAAGVRINECSSCVITDSNIIHAGTCVYLNPNAGAGHQVASVWVLQSFLDTSHIGFAAIPATNNDSINRVRLIGCWLSSMVTAGAVLGSASINVANSNSIDFIGCEIYQDPVGIDAQGVAEWAVRASRIAGCSTAAIRVVQGAQAGVHNFTISDNAIGNLAGFGANAVGITIAAGTYGRYQILDNKGLETNTTPGIADSGSVSVTGQKNVQNNMGGLVSGVQNLLTSGAAAFVATAGRGLVTSGTTETFLFTCRIPANAVSPGQQFRVFVAVQASSTGTAAFKVRTGTAGTLAGDTNIHFTATSAASAAANNFVLFNSYVTVVTVGNPGTVVATGGGQSLAAAFNQAAAAEVVGNVNMTIPWFITVTLAASVGTYTVKTAYVEAV
jgi:Pectate lyase superfamily protein